MNRPLPPGTVRHTALLGLALVLPDLHAGDVIFSEIMYQPPSGQRAEEWLELHNRGATPVNLAGWRLSAGVEFTFPPVELPAGGYLVVAADAAAFQTRYPGVTNFVAGWLGRLSDNGETVTLRNALDEVVDSVAYATEGDWAVRTRGPDDHGHRGWVWSAAHAGGGRSAERIHPGVTVDSGQNWAPSAIEGGTPGAANSMLTNRLAPLILNVRHRPAVPRSPEPVLVTARAVDDQPGPLTVTVWHRVDGAAAFTPALMADDGAHGDGRAGDGEFGAWLPAQPPDTVVEFYVEARDGEGLARTWPAPVQPENAQLANCLYQVDDRPYTAPQPLYRVILTAAERAELDAIDAMPWYWSSNAEMNGTFISTEAGESEVRYTIGFRLRGTTSRAEPVKSRRVNFNTDRRWRGLRAVNLNALNPHSQILGSVLARRAGLPAARARAVQLRENNVQKAPAAYPPFGVYAEVEVLNGDFAERQFPADGAGNLYQAIGMGNLDYLADPALYRDPRYYEKRSNTAEDDWSDLVELTRVLNTTPPETWLPALERVADVGEWITFFAANTVLANGETALGTGGPGDYYLYRGVNDPRFRLVIHDLDSVLGVSAGVNQPLWRATNNPAIHRFLTDPAIAPRYLAEVRRLMDEVLTPGHVEDLIEQFLGDFVPAATRRAMLEAYRARLAFLRDQMPAGLSVAAELPEVEGVQVLSNAVINLRGRADPTRTVAVRISGRSAAWNPLTGDWQVEDLPLLPGVNRLLVQSFDAAGTVVGEEVARVWRRGVPYTAVGGELAGDATWSAETGPYVVTNTLTVPAGVTLSITPGTTVFFWSNTGLLVRGRLVAEGTPEQRIHLGREPGASYVWSGLRFENSAGNVLRHADVARHNAPALYLTNSALRAEHVTFLGSFGNVLQGQDSTMVVRFCEFPDLPYGEHVRGDHLPSDGQWVFESNVFGTTTGYSDILDVSGGQRPGPVLQVLNNVFRGGPDDALDLDGAAAHIEGNVFLNFRKANDSTSEASAISTGTYEGRGADLVVVRNVFFGNDHDLILKEGSRVLAAHNTFIGARRAAILINEPQRPWEAPPQRGWFENCLFWDLPEVVGNLDPALLQNGTLQLEVRHSLLPALGPWAGPGNLIADPRLVNPTNDFRLRPGSPAAAAGSDGLDLGAYVPAGPVVLGTPPPLTWRRDVTFTVTGAGLTHFRWRLDSGPWSDPLPVNTPVALADLPEGPHQVFALGLNSAGVWQPEDQPSASRPWTVSPAAARLRLNEVLAANRTAWPDTGAYPNFVELVNDSPAPADLGGRSLSDDPLAPRKFVFPPGTVLAPGAYLVVRLIPGAAPVALTAGFGLEQDGDAVYLFDRPENDGGLLDQVQFGPQLADQSVGDRGDGTWTLCVPTPGAPNRAAWLGDPRRVRLNEWLARPGPSGPADFVELINPEELPVALDGLALTTEPVGEPRQFVFPPLSFLPGRGVGVFWADATRPPRGNHLPFRLSAEQGVLALVGPEGAWLDWVAYVPQLPGISQGRLADTGARVVSLPVPTPGSALALQPGGGVVRLSEVLAHNLSLTNAWGATSDWIELRNTGAETVSLAGLSLSDRLDAPRKWVFPADAVLPPGGFLVVFCEPALPPSTTNTGFGLSAEGESVYLFDRPESSGGVLDFVTFGPQAADFSLARLTPEATDWALARPTPGAANEPAELGEPSALRVNEWMANPAGGPDWFEVYNPAPLPVALEGLRLSDTAANPAKYTFPPRSFLGAGAGGFLVLWADENSEQGPAHLPFRLAAGGEAILLSRPDGTRIDEVYFGAQREDFSQGRFPDGAENVRELPPGGSPGGPNVLNARPRIAVLADQTVIAGRTWESLVEARDPDAGQTLRFSLRPPTPPGLTLDPATGRLQWTPGLDQAGLAYEVTVVVTDDGEPPQSAGRSFVLTVTEALPPPVWNPPWRDGAGRVHLSWAARPGARYAVDFTGDLAAREWQSYREVSAESTEVELVVPGDEAAQRFFRLRWLR
jgi:hypothetical protein